MMRAVNTIFHFELSAAFFSFVNGMSFVKLERRLNFIGIFLPMEIYPIRWRNYFFSFFVTSYFNSQNVDEYA